MMTLIALAITVAYAYSVAVTFGLEGMGFYWELATLPREVLVEVCELVRGMNTHLNPTP
jgi:cation transport ATPase